MPSDRKKALLWTLLFFLLFAVGLGGGYLYVKKRFPSAPAEQPKPESTAPDDSTFVRIFYPVEDKLVMEERRVKRTGEASLVELTVNEYLKGPSRGSKSVMPQGARLLGVYRGSDAVLYVDLSDDIRRGFQGDVLSEFLLLKGLFESIISNVPGVDDVKVLVEGKEVESIGGHLSALYPLKSSVVEAR